MPKRKSSSSTKTESVDWDSRWKRAQEERITLDLFDQYFSQEEVRIRVIGTRQNEYSVVIKRGDRSTCTCYDNRTNGFFCKHLMLVLIRTFRVPEELVANCQDVTHDIYLDCAFAYQERKEKDDLLWKEEIKRLEEEVQKESKQPKKKPIDVDDDCAICCENLLLTMINEQTIWCSTCGKTVHKKCFSLWKKQGKTTCVHCRAQTQFIECCKTTKKECAG